MTRWTAQVSRPCHACGRHCRLTVEGYQWTHGPLKARCVGSGCWPRTVVETVVLQAGGPL